MYSLVGTCSIAKEVIPYSNDNMHKKQFTASLNSSGVDIASGMCFFQTQKGHKNLSPSFAFFAQKS